MADYTLWRAELKETTPEDRRGDRTTLPHQMVGFWRICAAKTKPDFPVAIWQDAGQDAVIFQIGRRIQNTVEHADEWHQFTESSWLKCIAVTQADWAAALDNGEWGDGKPSHRRTAAEAAGVSDPGDNNAPQEDALADQIAALADTLNAAKEPTTQAEADALTEKLDRMRSLLKLAEAERVKEKAPILQQGKEIDAKWQTVGEPGGNAYRVADERRKAYLRKAQAKLDAIAAEETRRRREEAEAAAREEAERLADEARRNGEIAPVVEVIVPEVAPVEAERAKAGGAFGRSSSLRKVNVGVIEDAAKLATHFVTTKDADFMEYLQKRVSAAARAKVTLPGTSIKEELQ